MNPPIRVAFTSTRTGLSAACRAAIMVLILSATGVLILRAARPAPDFDALYLAATADDLGAFAEQVERMPDVNARDPLGFTPLMVASSLGRARAVEMLVDRGAAVDLPHPQLGTPLMLALSNGHAEAARILLARGADVNAVCDGFDPLTSAARADRPDCLVLVLEAGADVNRAGRRCNPLTLAVREGQVELLRPLLEAGADPNAPNADGTTPLFEAVERQATRAARLLLVAGANADHAGPFGLTPRAVAQRLGHDEMLEPHGPECDDGDIRDGHGGAETRGDHAIVLQQLPGAQ